MKNRQSNHQKSAQRFSLPFVLYHAQEFDSIEKQADHLMSYARVIAEQRLQITR
jgi:hypothetical protein